jgi:hypothetical protein
MAGSVSILLVRPLVHAVGSARAADLLAAIDVTPQILSDDDARVSPAQLAVAWSEAVRITSNPQLALAIAGATPVGAFGIVEYVCRAGSRDRDRDRARAASRHRRRDRVGLHLHRQLPPCAVTDGHELGLDVERERTVHGRDALREPAVTRAERHCGASQRLAVLIDDLPGREQLVLVSEIGLANGHCRGRARR